jgi:prepilin-type N-terminal cleavage/methylation domain-containing protein
MRRAQAGVSLLEIMVVVAIIGVLAGLSVAAYGKIGAASAPRNAVNDLTAALTRARSAATESQSDVWVIVYPAFNKSPPAASGGPGAYFLYEDKAGTFNRAAGGAAGEVYYQGGAGGVSFDPVADTLYGTASAEGRLLDSAFLDEYPGRNVLFALPTGGVTMAASDPPFAGLPVASACTFCSGAPLRGAIIFSADGSARFVDGSGAPVAANGAAAFNRAHALTLKDRPTPTTETRVYVVAVSGPTAFIGTYAKR